MLLPGPTKGFYSSSLLQQYSRNRSRIYTEEKAKVVAAAWGTDFIQFLAALAILIQDFLKNSRNSSFSSYHPGAINHFLHIVLVQKSLAKN